METGIAVDGTVANEVGKVSKVKLLGNTAPKQSTIYFSKNK